MKQIFTCLSIFIIIYMSAVAEEGRLLRYPNASAGEIAFCHGGDIYIVPVTGGLARRVTTSEGVEMFPRFSADGKWLAFSGEYDGNREIYTIPSIGGEPKRLTYSMDIPGLPERMGPDKIIMQWTSDGQNILYRSRHKSWNAWVGKLFYVSINDSLPRELPLPRSGFASLSPDGSKLAYNRVFREFRTWKRYRGGQADDIWIYDFNTKKIQNVTNNPAQDIIPMWYGDKIYFLSDRDHTMNLFVYNLATGDTKKITNFDKYDVKFPSIGPKYIAFENGGYIYLMDLATDEYRKVDIELASDNVWARPKILNVKDNIAEFDISPDGKRGLFLARGDIFTVPAEKGNIKDITNTSGVHERNVTWSPDGRWIAFISDETGKDEVYVVKPDGSGKTQLTTDNQSYRYELKWSPDSKKLINSDKTMRLFFIDVESKKVTQITKSPIWEIRDFSWSPDSRWIAYTDYVNNETPIIRLYSLETDKIYPVTDEYFGSYEPQFSKDGNYLFFISNRTFNPTLGEFELSFTYTNMSKIYGVTLRKDIESPFKFESDEAAVKEDKKDKKEEGDTDKEESKEKKKKAGENQPVKIDTSSIGDRIFGLPIAAADYNTLRTFGSKIYYIKNAPGSKPALMVYDLDDKTESQAGEFSAYEISADGKKIIYKSDKDYYITDLKDKIKTESGKLNLDDLDMLVDRKQEWRQIFEESWRQMKDFFYDPNMHGLDWPATRAKYEELLPFVTHRTDLTYIIGEMIGELNIGHAYVGGGEQPDVEKVPIGLLGAELELHRPSGFYRISKIYNGKNWDEKTRSPLTEPGINIKEGDYLIAIDGNKLSAADNPYKFLLNKANKFVALKVNSQPSESGAREYNVKTTASESGLFYMDWVATNRHKVDSATKGAVGYVQIPDMSIEGLNEFVKYFYPQVYKQGLIIDDRYNGGGFVSQMIIERLRRVLTMAEVARNQGVVMTYPSAVFTGPMVCLLNELSASDGDIFPYQFRKNNLGLLIGKRSWGGVIGIRGSMPFIDGGYMTRPEFANFGVEGQWVIEGVGTEPDIEVDNDPALEYQGIDQQLNKAIEVILEQIKTSTKPAIPKVPPYPIKK